VAHADVQRRISDLARESSGPSVIKVHRVFSQVTAWAVRDGAAGSGTGAVESRADRGGGDVGRFGGGGGRLWAGTLVSERLGWTNARSAGRHNSMVLDRSRLLTVCDLLTISHPDALPSIRRIPGAGRLSYLLWPQ
jgi:hypothetical protein